jgi:PAS domain S-box-containing protein
MIGQGSIWLRAPVVGLGYFILAYVCLSVSRFGAPVESIWLANALLVGALIATPRGKWALTLSSAGIGHVLAHIATHDGLNRTFAFLVGDLTECVLVASLLGARTMAFSNRKQIFWFLLCGGIVGPVVSAAVAALGSMVAGLPMEPHEIGMWAAADSLGMLIFLPLLHGFGHGRWELLKPRLARLAVAVTLVVAFSIMAAVFAHIPALRLLLLPIFVVVAFELGVAGAEICLAALMATWVTMAVNGVSPVPWVVLGPRDVLLTTQVFLAVFCATILPLAVALEQKQRLTDTLASTLKETQEAWGAIIGAEARYRLVVDNVSETVLRVAPGGMILFASPACAGLVNETELAGRNLFTLMDPKDAEREQEQFENAQASGLVNLINRRTWRLRTDEGEPALVDARITMVPNGERDGREFIVVLRPLS